jgi:hypothetical protein
VTLSAKYTEFLEQRRPEARIILAHYAVLLHRRRGAWSVGAAGKFLLDSIASYLGRHWETWLAWPQAVINGQSWRLGLVCNHGPCDVMDLGRARVGDGHWDLDMG